MRRFAKWLEQKKRRGDLMQGTALQGTTASRSTLPYFLKKRMFALLFFGTVFLFSAVNLKESFSALKKTITRIDWLDATDPAGSIARVDAAINQNMYQRMHFIEGYAYLQHLLDKRESNNFSYIQDEDGFLHYSSFFREEEEDLLVYARRLKRLQDYAAQYGTKVLFVVAPGKYVEGVTRFRIGMPVNDPNGVVDETLFHIKRMGIEILDLRKTLPNADLPYDKTFFRTDHHWTIPAAFYATKTLVETIEERFGENLDPTGYYTDIASYDRVMYPQGMLGSMGRRTGANFSGLEDFEALWPKFSGSYTRESMRTKDYTITAEGDFTKALMDVDILTENEDIYTESQYSLYMSGLSPYDRIVNQERPDGAKIFMIRDSYFSPVMAFLLPMCQSIDAIWSLEELDELDIESYVKENTFDYIIMEVYPYNIGDEAFNFFKEGR